MPGHPRPTPPLLRWAHVPIWVLVCRWSPSCARTSRRGRAWLAGCIVVLRTLALMLDFTAGENLNYLEIMALQRVPFLGEPVSMAVGTPNPWMMVGAAGHLAAGDFVVDACVTAWRRGARGKALSVGGGASFFCSPASPSACWCSGAMIRIARSR